jgi:predicted nucleotidyltransferase
LLPPVIDQLLSACGSLATGTRWYLFGSSVTGSKSPQDIDILIVYPDGEIGRAISLMNRLEKIPAAWNLDLVVLSQAEESEVDFVAHQHGVLLWPGPVT